VSTFQEESGLFHLQIEVGKVKAVEAYGLQLPTKAKCVAFFIEPSHEHWTCSLSFSLRTGGSLQLMSLEISNRELPKKYSGKYESEAEFYNSAEYLQSTLDGHKGLEKAIDAPVEKWQINRINKFYTEVVELASIHYLTLMPSSNGKGTVDWPSTHRRELADAEKIFIHYTTRQRHKIDEALLKQVSQLYVRTVKLGENPIAAIQAAYRVSHRTASDYATKAREAGFLPKTTPGKVTITKSKKRRDSE